MNSIEKQQCDNLYNEMQKGNVSWGDLTEYQTVLMRDYMDSNRDPITRHMTYKELAEYC